MTKNEPKPVAIVSIDIETTGKDPLNHTVMAIGAYVCDIFGNKIDTLEVFAKDLVWDNGSVSKFWNEPENATALKYNLDNCNSKGLSKQGMSEAITVFLANLKLKYHLVFVAAPTAFDLAYLISWFGDLMPFPRKAWIDAYSFYSGLRFFLTGKLKTDHKEYTGIRREMYAKWEGLHFKGEKHCALYDAYMQSGIMVEVCGEFDQLAAIINALKSHFTE